MHKVLQRAFGDTPGSWNRMTGAFFPINEEKYFVEVIHRNMHGEKVMAKKSKPFVKEESISSVEEEMIESVKKETISPGKEGEGFDAIRILMAIGALFGVIFLVFFILRYVLHVL